MINTDTIPLAVNQRFNNTGMSSTTLANFKAVFLLTITL